MRARGVEDAELRAEILVAHAHDRRVADGASATLPTLARAPRGDLLAVLGTLVDTLQDDGS